jgi:endoglucanase
MEEPSQFITQLIKLPGLSGYEQPIREVIAKKWRPLTDELKENKVGNLYGLRHAKETGRPTLMIGTHMDAIGLMVIQVDGEFLHVSAVGGVDPRILPGQVVTVHGRRELPGVAILWPDRLLNNAHKNQAPNYSRILIDVGLTSAELSELVEVGDLVSFNTQPMQLSGDAIAGHSLDNRASIAALTLCLEELQHTELPWNLVAVATVCEEVNFAGSTTAAFELNPDLAIAVDVTFGKGPGSTDFRTFDLGKGPTIGIGPNIHPYLYKKFKEIAESNDVPYAIETMPSNSGTDGMAFQVGRSGIPNMVIGIPLRYMHTPVEEVVLADIRRTAHLLSSFIKSLNIDTLAELEKEMLA